LIKIAAVRQSSAGGHARGEDANEQKGFHAGIESERHGRVNATRNQLRKRPLRGKFFLRQGLWMED
jgi:hypothetical protein